MPLIIYDPRATEAERGLTTDALALSIDVPATILSFAGLETLPSMQGRDLRRLMADPSIDWRDEIFLESLFLLRTGPFTEAVRTKEWKYVRYFPNPGEQYNEADVDFEGREPCFEQFFDLVNDPAVILDPALQERVEEFRERCRHHSAALVKARREDRLHLN